MCRYAFKTYKPHFVCFDCRKTFKQPLIEDMIIQNGDWDKYQQAFINPHSSWNFKYSTKEDFQKDNNELVDYLQKKYLDKKYLCPNCRQEMFNIGLDFKAPKKEKIKEWEIVKRLYYLGRTFHSCGCDGPGYIPRNKTDYLTYLSNIKIEYEQNLKSRNSEFTASDHVYIS